MFLLKLIVKMAPVRWHVFVPIQGHEANPVVGIEDRFQEDEEGEDDSHCKAPAVQPRHKGHHDADQASKAPNGSQEGSRHQEHPCFVPRKALKGKGGKGKGDGIDQQKSKHNQPAAAAVVVARK